MLAAEDMVICDDTGPISLAAVMGGQTSEVDPGTTTDVLFEAAHWDPTMVGRTARRHKLFSEAAKRWERGVDRELRLVAVERAVALLRRVRRRRAPASAILDLELPDAAADHHARPGPAVAADRGRRTRRTGWRSCSRRSAARSRVNGDRADVTPPSWRPDLLGPADLTEEVVRLDGFDKVPSALPIAPPGRGLTPGQRRRRSVGRTLAEQGYVEVLSVPVRVARRSLTSPGPADRRRSGWPTRCPTRSRCCAPPCCPACWPRCAATSAAASATGRPVRAGAGLPADRRPGRRRRWGSPPAARRGALAAANASVPHQPWHVAVVLAGELEPAGWWGPGRPPSWSDAVAGGPGRARRGGRAESAVAVRAGDRAPWHPGRCAEILVGGHGGRVTPASCTRPSARELELPRRTCAMELDLDAVPLPGVDPGPGAVELPARADRRGAGGGRGACPPARCEAALVDGAGPLLEAVRLFDVYTGTQVGAGRKSLAYKLTFRAPDRTLTAEEAVAARDAAVALAAKRFGATLRGA